MLEYENEKLPKDAKGATIVLVVNDEDEEDDDQPEGPTEEENAGLEVDIESLGYR